MFLAYYDEALTYMEKAIELDSTFASAYLFLGQIYGAVGNVKEHLDAIKKAKKFSQGLMGKEKLLIDAAYTASIENDLKTSMQIVEQCAREYPDDKYVHFNLGSIYFNIGDKRAMDELNKTLELDPDFGPAINFMIYYYLKPDILDYDKALEHIRKYMKLFPNDANPHDTMGDIFYSMGRIEDAIEKYKDASRIIPGFSEYKIGYMYALIEDYENSFEWINQSITLAKTSGQKAERYQLRGFIKYWLGKYKNGVQDIEKAIDYYTEMNNTYRIALSNFQLYMFYQEFGDHEKSDIYFTKMKEYFDSENSDLNHVFSIMFKMLINIDNFDLNDMLNKAEESSSMILNLRTSKEWALYFYNGIFTKRMIDMGVAKTAIKFYQNKNNLKIQVPSAVQPYIIYNFTRKNVLGFAYFKNGDVKSALAEYEKIMHLNPDRNDLRLIHPTFHYEIGMIYEKDGQNSKATQHFQKFLNLWKDAPGNTPEILDAKEWLKKLS